MPQVSIIIPTYNRAGYITQAIDSVLAQTYRDYEIIIVDDGSTDDTRGVLAAYWDKIHYMYQCNQGVSAARNAGIRAAKGEWIAFLDSDDEWLLGKLEAQIQDIKQNPAAVLSCTNVRFEGPDREPVDYFRDCLFLDLPATTFLEKPLFKCYAWTSTVLVRRTKALDVGLFDEDLTIHEDSDLYFRLFTKGGIVINPLIFAEVHRRPESININLSDQILRNAEKNHSTLVKIYKKLIHYNISGEQARYATGKLSDSWYDLGLYYYGTDNKRQARRCFWEAFFARRSIKTLLKLLAGLSGKCGLKLIAKQRNTRKIFRRSDYYQHESSQSHNSYFGSE